MQFRMAVLALLVGLLSGCAKAPADSALTAEAKPELMELKETLIAAKEVYVPEQEMNVVGSVAYYPGLEAHTLAIAGSNCISLFFQNENVTQGSGTIALFETDTQKKVAALEASDTTHVVVSDLTDEGKVHSGFATGTQVDIFFDYPFAAGKSYFVLMDGGCFLLGRVASKAVTDADLLVFGVKDYGFAGDWRSIYHPSDFAFFDILLGQSI